MNENQNSFGNAPSPLRNLSHGHGHPALSQQTIDRIYAYARTRLQHANIVLSRRDGATFICLDAQLFIALALYPAERQAYLQRAASNVNCFHANILLQSLAPRIQEIVVANIDIDFNACVADIKVFLQGMLRVVSLNLGMDSVSLPMVCSMASACPNITILTSYTYLIHGMVPDETVLTLERFMGQFRLLRDVALTDVPLKACTTIYSTLSTLPRLDRLTLNCKRILSARVGDAVVTFLSKVDAVSLHTLSRFWPRSSLNTLFDQKAT
jgi:hypothetical protein